MWTYLYAVVGIFVVGGLGAVGVLIPSILARFLPNYNITKKFYFTFFTGLAAGLILGVGFVHCLPEGIGGFDEALASSEEAVMDMLSNSTSSSLSVESSSANASVSASSEEAEEDEPYAWGAWIAMMAVLLAFLSEEAIDSLSNLLGIKFNPHSHGQKSMQELEDTLSSMEGNNMVVMVGDDDATKDTELNGSDNEDQSSTPRVNGVVHDEENGTNNNNTKVVSSSGDLIASSDSKAKPHKTLFDYLKPITKMLVLFVGLTFHNVFVGIALGVADNDRALFIALIFHQFFEGLGMGARVAMTNMKRVWIVLVIDTVFSLACPIGIVIGILIRVNADGEGFAYMITQALFQSLSAGMLIYVSLIHMIRAYEEVGEKGWKLEAHKWLSYLGVLLGAAIMSVIGIWA